MKNILNVIGIDVSKLKIDACNYHSVSRQTFTNDVEGFRKLHKWIGSMSSNGCLICFENTGYYSLGLAVFLVEKGIVFSMIAPIEIKRSLGLVRGKNDAIDAYQIARYGWLHRDELEPSSIPAKLVLELSQMLSVREQFVKQKVALENILKAYSQIPKMASKDATKLLKQQIRQLQQQIVKAEEAIKTVVEQTELTTNFKLLCTIKGIGSILASQLIVHSNNFSSFTEWRQFACYAGLAPFDYQSGTSVKGRTKVHPIADKNLKRLLNLAALSAIQHDPELKIYYKRKVAEGKNKMCAINAVRCKVLSRAFSVIKRQTPYVPLFAFAA